METFVVRVWRPAPGEADSAAAPLTGVVEHIGTGRTDPFQGTQRLAELIATALAASQSQGDRGRRVGGTVEPRPPK